ncbi:ATP synthase F0 subcomplex A subunit [Rhizobiales bacterium GAS188]|nr:ATP synthase F0 subcomplex A subunit [Rhizobiales bacterium GAS188]
MNPIEQFEISTLKSLGNLGNYHFAFTNSSAYMVLCFAIIAGVTLFAMRGDQLVPGRLQSAVEAIYEFIADTVRQSAGEEGMKFFPFVFSIFAFVLVCNLIGLVPYTFTVTSHIIVTASLAILVFAIVIGYGFWKNGLGFLHLFAPSGVPGWLMPLIVVIEIISFLSRPLSLSVRLFANMLAGHMALSIIASFVAILLGAGLWAILAPVPLAMTVALVALEALVAFLQAYVFAILTCIYLNDALHPHH